MPAVGVEHCIEFSNTDVAAYAPPAKPSLVVSNPPWGMRLEKDCEEAWRGLGAFLRRECGGSSAWLLSGDKRLTRELRMRAGSKLSVEQADNSLRFLR